MPKIYSNNPFYPEETGAFRHELKLLCSAQDLAIVRARLKNLLPFDTHAGENGQYTIRSLYFDDYNDSCLRENEAGWTTGGNTASGCTTAPPTAFSWRSNANATA